MDRLLQEKEKMRGREGEDGLAPGAPDEVGVGGWGGSSAEAWLRGVRAWRRASREAAATRRDKGSCRRGYARCCCWWRGGATAQGGRRRGGARGAWRGAHGPHQNLRLLPATHSFVRYIQIIEIILESYCSV